MNGISQLRCSIFTRNSDMFPFPLVYAVKQKIYGLAADECLTSTSFGFLQRPAARKLGLDWVHWRSLRTSHAVWLKMAGADVKDALGQMRDSRASTTLDIYQQFVPESQQRVVNKLSSLSTSIN